MKHTTPVHTAEDAKELSLQTGISYKDALETLRVHAELHQARLKRKETRLKLELGKTLIPAMATLIPMLQELASGDLADNGSKYSPDMELDRPTNLIQLNVRAGMRELVMLTPTDKKLSKLIETISALHGRDPKSWKVCVRTSSRQARLVASEKNSESDLYQLHPVQLDKTLKELCLRDGDGLVLT